MSKLQIPESWALCKVGDVLELKNGYAFKSAEFSKHGIKVVRISNIQDGSVDLTDAVYVKDHPDFHKFEIKRGDLLIAMSGATTGKMGIYESDERAFQNQRVGNIKIKAKDAIDPRFRNSYFSLRQSDVLREAYGGAQPNISGSMIERFDFYLPPLEEQKRIVAKIESTHDKVGVIESCISRVEKLIEKYRESILQKAFRGGLLTQNSNDEPATKLIERIRALSTNQSGNKKSGELPTLRPEETKFEIPKSWAWMRISELGTWGGGITPSKANSSYWNRGTIAWTSPKDMKTDLITSSEDQITRTALDECNISLYPVGSVLIVTRSGILRHTLPVAVLGIESTVNQDIKALIPHKEINSDFVFFYLKAFERDLLRICGKKGATVESIDFDKFLKTPVPVPPKAEQIRLVDALKKSLSSIDSLSSNVRNIREVHKALFTAILENAFKGTLVPQIDSEGTGHDLVTSVQTAKSDADVRSNPEKLKKRRK